MNVSLSKNEQIVLFVLVFVIIAVAGTILFLMPSFETIEASQALRDQKRAEFNSLSESLGLAKFQEVEAAIMQAYEDGKHASANFYSEAFTDYNADRLIRGVLAEIDLTINNLVINRLRTHNLRLIQHRDPHIVYDLQILAEIYNEENELMALIGDGNPTSAVIDPPENLEKLNDLRLYMMTANRAEGLDFFTENRDNINLDLATAMREFLARNDETVMVQSVRFDIPLTVEKADELSMHIYKLNEVERVEGENFKTTYISSMVWKDNDESDTVGGGIDGAPRIYTVEILFFVIHPMQTPSFDYEDKFPWG